MYSQYKAIYLTIDELSELDIPKEEPILMNINYNSINYEFLLNIKKKSSKMLVFASGAYNVDKIKPPVFQRHTWANYFDDSSIFFNDPTLYLGQISLGWGYGTSDRFYLSEIATILLKILEKLNIQVSKTLFYGSSGGGFMALILSGFLKGSIALVNNPQTKILNYYNQQVNRLLNLIYPNLSREEIVLDNLYRLDVIEFYRTIRYIPRIFYLQNALCSSDMERQLIPFISQLKNIECLEFNNVKAELYFDREGGHSPLGLEDTTKYINKCILEYLK